jgi:hypothetical protein
MGRISIWARDFFDGSAGTTGCLRASNHPWPSGIPEADTPSLLRALQVRPLTKAFCCRDLQHVLPRIQAAASFLLDLRGRRDIEKCKDSAHSDANVGDDVKERRR